MVEVDCRCEEAKKRKDVGMELHDPSLNLTLTTHCFVDELMHSLPTVRQQAVFSFVCKIILELKRIKENKPHFISVLNVLQHRFFCL